MSVLGVSLSDAGVVCTVRPDQAGPARMLEDVLDLPLPSSTVRVDDDETASLSDLLGNWFFGRLDHLPIEGRARHGAAIIRYFDELIETINSHPLCTVVLMDVVETLAFVAPTGASREAIRTFSEEIRLLADLTVIVEPTAWLAHAADKPLIDESFLWCDWSEHLALNRARGYETLQHTGVAAGSRRRKDMGPAALRRRLIHAAAIAPPEADALLSSLTDSENVESSPEAERVLEALKLQARNFIQTSAASLREKDCRYALVTTSSKNGAWYRAVATRALESAGLKVVSDRVCPALGVHSCVRARPMLPYDCGILIKKDSAAVGIGTLVLVRPTAIGQRRVSELLRFPARNGDALSFAFYLRRLSIDTAGTRVTSEIMKSHALVARTDAEGDVKLQVAMQVNEDDGAPEGVSVSIEVSDLVAEQDYRFDGLRLVGVEEMQRAPARHADEMLGAELGAHLAQIVQQAADNNYSVGAWLNALAPVEGGGGGDGAKIPREQYAMQLLTVAAVEDNDALLDLLTTADPEQFQAVARGHLFERLRLIAKQHDALGSVRLWLRKYGNRQQKPPSVDCSAELVNALSVGLAGQPGEEQVVDDAKVVHQFYTYACGPSSSLNIDW